MDQAVMKYPRRTWSQSAGLPFLMLLILSFEKSDRLTFSVFHSD